MKKTSSNHNLIITHWSALPKEHFASNALCLLLSLLFLPTIAYSEAYDFAVNDISTVAPGDTQTFNLIDSEFWGLDWDETWSAGNSKLGDGDSDNDPWNGYYVGVETKGRVGLYADAAFDYGTMDINSQLDVNLEKTKTGDVTTVTTDYSTQSGSGFSTSGTTGNIDVGLTSQIEFGYVISGALLGNTASISGVPATGDIYIEPFVDLDQNSPPLAETFAEGTVNVTAQIPNVVVAGSFSQASGQSASYSGTDSILAISYDIDQALANYFGVPVSVDVDFYSDWADVGLKLNASIINLDLGAQASLSQDFAVTMNPEVTLEFAREVFVADDMGSWYKTMAVTKDLGSDIEIMTITPYIVEATTTYSMDWQVANNTAIDIDAYFELNVGSLSGVIGYGFDSYSFNPGPLYNNRFETPLAEMSLYDESWLVAGQNVAGDDLFINLDANLLGMLTKDIFDNTQTFNVTPLSIDARTLLGVTVDQKTTATTPTGTKDLFSENTGLLNFMAAYIDDDYTRVDYLDMSSREDLINLLWSYYPGKPGYFDFLLDESLNLGVDFEPIFDDSELRGLMASFYSLEDFIPSTDLCTFGCPDEPDYNDLLANLGLDNLLDMSLTFFYSDVVDMTELTIYERSPFDLGSFVYADSSVANDNAPVPEPATMLLFGTGLVGLVGFRLRKKKK